MAQSGIVQRRGERPNSTRIVDAITLTAVDCGIAGSPLLRDKKSKNPPMANFYFHKIFDTGVDSNFVTSDSTARGRVSK
jgi:hypothetical protein